MNGRQLAARKRQHLRRIAKRHRRATRLKPFAGQRVEQLKAEQRNDGRARRHVARRIFAGVAPVMNAIGSRFASSGRTQ